MIDQVRELIAQYGDQLALAVSVSGGKDSTRMMGYLEEFLPDVKKYYVYADTGFEHVRPVTAEQWARERAAAYGKPLYTVRNPNKTFLTMIEYRHATRPDVPAFPSSGQRQCTSDLKRGPIQVFMRHLPEKILINCTGIRAAESRNRAKANPWTYDEGMSKAGRKVWNWMPIFNESLQDVIHWHWRSGTPLHPVYVPEYHCDGTTGGYLRRLSCRVCIFSTDSDIRAIHEKDREAFDAIAQLEAKTGYTLKNGKSLLQIVEQGAFSGKQYGSEELFDRPCI
jgi:3'-phosphoadenosine 5'-phosphosulfate sulfotransferase (PAPS reductase)/FAD synthetase